MKIVKFNARYTAFLFIISLFSSISWSQTDKHWSEYMLDRSVNFYDAKNAFDSYWSDKSYDKGKGFKQYKRWEWLVEPRVYPSGERFPMHHAYYERANFLRTYSSTAKSDNSWEPLGPTRWEVYSSTGYNPGLGRINVIVEHPTNSAIIYAGTPSGGLWKTENGGDDWTPLTDDFPALGISGIVINYENPNVIYVSTGDGDGADTYSIGVLKSIDGGVTWETTGLVHSILDEITTRKLVMHPSNPNILLVATNSGLYKTIDAGENWYLVQNGSIRGVLYHPTDPSIVYLSTSFFYKSIDGGESFGGIKLASAGNNRMELAVSIDEPDWVYAVVGNNSDQGFRALHLSKDAGESFEMQTDSPNLFGYAMDGSDEGGQSWFDMAIAVDPADAKTVFVGGVNVWKSSDEGKNFEINSHWVYPSSIGYTHADIHSLDFYNGKLYCGSDGGIFISLESGEGEWMDLTPGMQISQFYRFGNSPSNPEVMIGGTQDNGSKVYLSGDWEHVLGADGMDAGISPDNPDVMFCTQQFGSLYRTLNGGFSWNWTMNGNGESGGWVTPLQVLTDSKIAIAYENVWMSQNNGNSFNRISDFFEGSANCLTVHATDHNYIFVSYGSKLYRTKNGGDEWGLVSDNLPNLFISDIEIHKENPEKVWVTFSGFNSAHKVYFSSDSGDSWNNITYNLPNLPANTIVHQKDNHQALYVGMDVGIYYMDTLTNQWETYDDKLPNVIVNDLEILEDFGLLRAATYGRGIWENKLKNFVDDSGEGGTTSVLDIKSTPFKLYPNPTQGVFSVVPASNEPYTIKVYDNVGRLIQEVDLSQGLTKLDLSIHPAALYTLRIETSTSVNRYKLIKVD